MKQIKRMQKTTVWVLIALLLCSAWVAGFGAAWTASAEDDVLLTASEEDAAPVTTTEEAVEPAETTEADAAPAATDEAAEPAATTAEDAAPPTAAEEVTEPSTVGTEEAGLTTTEEAVLTTTEEEAPTTNDEDAAPATTGEETEQPTTAASIEAAPVKENAEGEAPAVSISASSVEVERLGSIQLTANVTGVSGSPSLRWQSSDASTAIVNGSGKVTGISLGMATITVTASVDGLTLTDAINIYVVRRGNGVLNLLKDRQVLSYQYSYRDDYYYANDKAAWQKALGFSKFYDLVAPYAMLETDYLRVKFPYEGKDWMIQLWKGQYGFVFYGSEIGIYTKRHTNLSDNTFTLYKCADQGDFLNMEMTLYHDTTGFGTYERQFTRPYDSYWWCTGFKPGHLRREEPATELRVEARITMKSEEMARLFCDAIAQCGFTEAADGNLGLDQYSRSGLDVRLVWQNISHAETTMPVKVVAGANVLAFFLGPFAFLSMLFLDVVLLLFVRL